MHFKEAEVSVSCKLAVNPCLSRVSCLSSGLQCLKTSQQEPCAEIPPVDAPVNDRCTPFDAQRPQGFGQFLISPATCFHAALHQQDGLKAPFRNGLRLGIRKTGLGQERNWPAGLVHTQRRLHRNAPHRRQLKSILTHSKSSCLYLCPNLMEANHA